MGARVRSLFLGLAVMLSVSEAVADEAKERAAVIAVDLAGGAPDFMRAKAHTGVTGGLTAAGFDVVPQDQVSAKLAGDLAACRQGPCLASAGKAIGATFLVVVTITRKDESTIIVIRGFDPKTGEMIADIHEVCDLCGQSELGDRVDVAASALRVKAKAELQRRLEHVDLPRVTGRLRVGIVPGIAVNVDNVRVDALSQDLADALAQELDIDTIGGLEVRRRLPAEGIPLDCVTNPICVRDTAKRLDANQLLFVVMVNTGANGAIQVDTTWVDPAAERTATRRPIDIAVVDQARTKFAASARLLLPDAPVRKKEDGGKGPSFNGRMSDAVPRHFTKPAMIAAGVAVVGLGVGVGFGIKTRSSYNDCEKIPGSCNQSDKDSIRNKSIVADVGFVVAAGAAVTAAVMFATSGKESKLVVGPSVESNGGGVSVFGRF